MFERLEHELDAGRERREAIQAGADRRLKPSSPTFSTYFLGTTHPALAM
ncbi:MAG: hypothetical protein ACREF4_04545 [Gammaproteobacteria bacterium]